MPTAGSVVLCLTRFDRVLELDRAEPDAAGRTGRDHADDLRAGRPARAALPARSGVDEDFDHRRQRGEQLGRPARAEVWRDEGLRDGLRDRAAERRDRVDRQQVREGRGGLFAARGLHRLGGHAGHLHEDPAAAAAEAEGEADAAGRLRADGAGGGDRFRDHRAPDHSVHAGVPGSHHDQLRGGLRARSACRARRKRCC